MLHEQDNLLHTLSCFCCCALLQQQSLSTKGCFQVVPAHRGISASAQTYQNTTDMGQSMNSQDRRSHQNAACDVNLCKLALYSQVQLICHHCPSSWCKIVFGHYICISIYSLQQHQTRQSACPVTCTSKCLPRTSPQARSSRPQKAAPEHTCHSPYLPT